MVIPPGRASLVSQVEQLSEQELQQLTSAILRERRQRLPEELATLADEAAAYKAEMQRHDNAHKARLQKRRDALEASIRRARALLHDWPITDDEIERELPRFREG